MQASVLQKENEITLQGEVTFETISFIQKEVTRLLQTTVLPAYQINLESVTLVNSAALGLLVELKKQAIAKNKTITFVGPPERLLALAHVCGVAVWLGL